jgi:hypothetical protein
MNLGKEQTKYVVFWFRLFFSPLRKRSNIFASDRVRPPLPTPHLKTYLQLIIFLLPPSLCIKLIDFWNKNSTLDSTLLLYLTHYFGGKLIGFTLRLYQPCRLYRDIFDQKGKILHYDSTNIVGYTEIFLTKMKYLTLQYYQHCRLYRDIFDSNWNI